MDNKQTEVLSLAARELDIVDKQMNDEQLRNIIVEHIRQMIHSDFQRLINLLYRMDVSEVKLRSLIDQNPEADAGELIATLIIERQAEKLKTRSNYRQPPPDTKEELW